MKQITKDSTMVQELSEKELMEINGGGFFEDFGYWCGYLFGRYVPDSYVDYASSRF